MKTITIALLAMMFAAPAMARGGHSSHAATGTGSSSSRTHVSGYTTKTGKYVAPHNRSTKDSTKRNNWTTKGNTNPDTGKAGSK